MSDSRTHGVGLDERVYITDFAWDRHFKPGHGCTFINQRVHDFQAEVNHLIRRGPCKRRPGYADFCELIFLNNWTDARVGTIKLRWFQFPWLKIGYKARNYNELPVLSRWFENKWFFRLVRLIPKAKFLCIVLYSAEQLAKEGTPIPEKFKWGAVAILGQSENKEEPMTPATMLRNALGIEEGGSGDPLDREAYMRSVKFWENRAVVLQE